MRVLCHKLEECVRLTRNRLSVTKSDHSGTKAEVSERSHDDQNSARDLSTKRMTEKQDCNKVRSTKAGSLLDEKRDVVVMVMLLISTDERAPCSKPLYSQ